MKIALVGAGGLAWSLAPAIRRAGLALTALYAPDGPNAEALAALADAPHCRWPAAPDEFADVFWLAAPDDALPQLADLIAARFPGRTLLHSSGATPLAAVKREGLRAGVIYPLASFSRGATLDLRQYPLFYEAEPEAEATVRALAESLSATVHRFDSEQRLVLHVGAVWANNFSNLMLDVAGELMQRAGLSVDARVYLPLMRGMIDKLETLSPAEAQTGPARRGDRGTISRHRELLRTLAAEVEPIYAALSAEIERRHDKGERQT